jgi:hypothetical protein
MSSFKDTIGREWSVVCNVGTIKAVRDALQVDLVKLFQDEAGRIFGDPVLLVNVLYVVCKKQADERKLTDEDFGSSLSGDSLEAGASALIDAVILFFPQSRQKILRATVEKSEQINQEMEAKAIEAIGTLTAASLRSAMSSQGS